MKNKLKYTIKELPPEERPREKLQSFGPRNLSNFELLALLMGSGSKERTALELSQDLICMIGGMENIDQLTLQELQKMPGIGMAKSSRIIAAVELGRRLQLDFSLPDKQFTSPEAAAKFFIPRLKKLQQEICMVMLLNSQQKLISTREITRGSLTQSIMHPREVFKFAIKASAAGIILAHNHPSGETRPSENDLNVTEKMIDAGEIVGIPVLDHIIVGGNEYLSMKEKELI